MSPNGIRVEPDILVSVHGLAPGSNQQFQKPENILDGVNYCVLGTHSSAMTSPTLYFHATGYWPIYHAYPLGKKYLA